MKLSYEDKIKIYELRQSGQSIKSLSKQFTIAESSIKYMARLIDRRGINIVQKGKNTYYPPKLKQEMINKVLIDGHSLNQVALEFALPNGSEKLYLSPVLDGYNSEIIDFTLSRSPNLMQVKSMLEKAFPEETYPNTILHSDQGWQYQHEAYHRFLDSKGIRPSMSRKGTSTDNGMMESFFGILKSEMFYGFEKSFKSLDQLEQAITNYIFYYNNKRIKAKLKGLSPVQYRTKSFH